MHSPDPRTGVLLSLTAAFSAAAFLIPYKAAGARAPLDVVVMAMLFVAAVLNTALLLAGRLRAGIQPAPAAPPPRRSLRLTVLLSLVLAAFTTLGNWAAAAALIHIGAGLTSVVQQTQVLFVAAGAALLLRERITARYAIGALIALAGFAVMRLPGIGAGPGPGQAGAGMLWATASALSFGIMHVVTRKFIHRIDPVPVNALRLWLAAALLACWPGRLAALARLDAGTWALIAAAAFAGPFIGRIALMYGLRHIAASHAILLNLTSPVFAFGLGFLAFGTAPTGLELAGGALILAGTALPVLESTPARMPRPGLTSRR